MSRGVVYYVFHLESQAIIFNYFLSSPQLSRGFEVFFEPVCRDNGCAL
ncbi:hypothetical protein PROVALCAL_00051 [Providencia alcalifaciens DSM 30120]|uniref:Uncharacterized protein n=1 Tax=Providencia alcalifaciens DSM 30120 TaxID=520999 RepID=B6X9Q6_9GAMM|nr:hypothetical protein PROVALCAL_00051 [Providencia alcalifaciens DSM 30120]